LKTKQKNGCVFYGLTSLLEEIAGNSESLVAQKSAGRCYRCYFLETVIPAQTKLANSKLLAKLSF
jgi:hypothetical protein